MKIQDAYRNLDMKQDLQTRAEDPALTVTIRLPKWAKPGQVTLILLKEKKEARKQVHGGGWPFQQFVHHLFEADTRICGNFKHRHWSGQQWWWLCAHTSLLPGLLQVPCACVLLSVIKFQCPAPSSPDVRSDHTCWSSILGGKERLKGMDPCPASRWQVNMVQHASECALRLC